MTILLEQLVYGSFPFWDRGYDVLARSPGCRPEWSAEVLAACRRFGEAPSGVTPASALVSIRLASGPRAIVGVEPLGADDRGRPGALAFHALLVAPRDFRKAGADPFAFAGAIRRDWSAETILATLPWTVEPPDPVDPPSDPRTRRIVEALSNGKRAAIESAEPIDGLAREVWAVLPESVRNRASMATWAFGNANRFDLVGLPRLAGIEFDPSYVDLEAQVITSPLRPRAFHHWRGAAIGSLAAILAHAWIWWSRNEPPPPPEAPASQPTHPSPTIMPGEQARIVAGLGRLAGRLGVELASEPGTLMAAIDDRFHYRGATLTPIELERLTAEGDPDRDRALGWHRRITGTFAADRPLPADFASLPLDRQLDRLAWSFHLNLAPGPEAIPAALIRALAREGPVRPTPLAARYPPLSEYARFLGKLPRRVDP